MAARATVPFVIHNGHCTERNAIWSIKYHTLDFKIGRRARSTQRAARVRFEITRMISDQNFSTRISITTLLQPF